MAYYLYRSSFDEIDAIAYKLSALLKQNKKTAIVCTIGKRHILHSIVSEDYCVKYRALRFINVIVKVLNTSKKYSNVNFLELLTLIKIDNNIYQDFEQRIIRYNSGYVNSLRHLMELLENNNNEKYKTIMDIINIILICQKNNPSNVLQSVRDIAHNIRCHNIEYIEAALNTIEVNQVLIDDNLVTNIVPHLAIDDNIVYIDISELENYLNQEYEILLSIDNSLLLNQNTINLLTQYGGQINCHAVENILVKAKYNIQELFKSTDVISSVNKNKVDLFCDNQDNISAHQSSLFLEDNNDNETTKIIKLSPTSIQLLNKNPYFFWLKHTLGLRPLNDIDSFLDVKTMGIVIHKIIENFANFAQSASIAEINSDQFRLIAKQTLQSFFGNTLKNQFILNNIDLLSSKIIDIELNAKRNNLTVLCEHRISQKFSNNITIEAIIDRLEINEQTKEVNVYDFKSQSVPTLPEELSGLKSQLSIISVILQNHMGYKVNKLAYVSPSETFVIKDIDNAIAIVAKNLESLINAINDDSGILKVYLERKNIAQYPEEMFFKHFSRKFRYLV